MLKLMKFGLKADITNSKVKFVDEVNPLNRFGLQLF